MILGSLKLKGSWQEVQEMSCRKNELVLPALHFVLLSQGCCTHQVKIHPQGSVTQPPVAFANTDEIMFFGNGLRCVSRAGAVMGVACF